MACFLVPGILTPISYKTSGCRTCPPRPQRATDVTDGLEEAGGCFKAPKLGPKAKELNVSRKP